MWSVPNIVSSKSRTVQYRVPRCPSQYRNVQVPSCPGTEMSRIQKDTRPCLCMCMDELYWKKKKWKKALLSHIVLHIFIHQSSEKVHISQPDVYLHTRCRFCFCSSGSNRIIEMLLSICHIRTTIILLFENKNYCSIIF